MFVKALLAVIFAAALAVSASAADDPVASALIGYGHVQMTATRGPDGQGTVTFACDSAAKADQLLSKLRADGTLTAARRI